MASSAGFVQAVLSTVCLQALRPTLPPVPPLSEPQRHGEFVAAETDPAARAASQRAAEAR